MAYLLSLDWYKVVFLIEIFIAEALFVLRLEKRSLFPLRLTLGVFAALAAAYFIPVFVYNAVSSSVIFLTLFILSVGVIVLCFKDSIANILFCSVAAYTTQHLAYQFFNFVLLVTGLMNEPLGVYGSTMPENANLLFIPVYLVSYFIVYWAVIYLMNLSVPNWKRIHIKSVSMLGLVFVVLAVDIIVNAVIVYASYDDWNRIFILSFSISSVVCCLMTLWVQCNLVEKKELKNELENIYHIYSQEQKQFAASRTNVDLINQKCHDLKYQIRAIAQSGAVKESVIREIEDAIFIYDSTVKTGNKTLDTILTEKSLLCRKNNVTFTSIVDGERLNFINAVDLYTLFGNAVDNALEAVMGLEEGYRVISLTTKLNGDLLSVNLKNYYDGDLKFKDNLPQTTKGDKNYHGFGLKSIKSIVEKYGGDMYVTAHDGVFNLNLLFFLDKLGE